MALRALRLGRDRILRSRRALERTLRTGEVVRTPYFRLRYLAGPPPAEAAFLAGRQVGGAVRRNRAKRVLREAYRLCAVTPRGVGALVFIATDRTAGADSCDVRSAMADALRRASGTVG